MDNLEMLGLSQDEKNQRRYTPEEYKEYKQNERKELFEMADSMAEQTFSSPEALNGYLSLQARMGALSTTNTLLVMGQRPDATLIRDYDQWLDQNHGVKKGEHGIKILEAAGEYERADGKGMATSYNARRVYDITQTRGGVFTPPPEIPIADKLKALTMNSPVPFKASESVGKDEVARYSATDNVIYVSSGKGANTPEELFAGVAREMCVAEGANRFAGECAAKIVCDRYNVPVAGPAAIPPEVQSMETLTKRTLLNNVRNTSVKVYDHVRDGLSTLQQQRAAAERKAAYQEKPQERAGEAKAAEPEKGSVKGKLADNQKAIEGSKQAKAQDKAHKAPAQDKAR